MSDNSHLDGEFVLLSLALPSFICWAPAEIIGGEGEGEGGTGRSEGGEETKLPKVFPPDSPYRVKDERRVRMEGSLVAWNRWGDSVREQTGLSFRDSGGKEK